MRAAGMAAHQSGRRAFRDHVRRPGADARVAHTRFRHCLDLEAAAEASHGPASDDIIHWE